MMANKKMALLYAGVTINLEKWGDENKSEIHIVGLFAASNLPIKTLFLVCGRKEKQKTKGLTLLSQPSADPAQQKHKVSGFLLLKGPLFIGICSCI
ncbi:MAG: hypothetical protein WCJ84_06545 [Candidatus Peregrinibacteria bacterium]